MNNFNENENYNYPRSNYENGNYNEANYEELNYEVPKNQKKLTYNSSRILTWSLLWFGIGFLLVAGLGSLWVYLVTKGTTGLDDFNSQGFMILWVVLGCSLVASIIFSLFSSLSRRTNSFAMSLFSFIFYVLMFSVLFAVISIIASVGLQNKWLVLIAFAITGGLTLLSGLIAAGLTAKGLLTLGKAITIIMCVLMIGNLIFMLSFGFISSWTLDIWYYIYDSLFCIVMIGFMIFTFFKIINFSRALATEELSTSQLMTFSIAFGTEILINFMIIFMYVIRLLSKRN